MNNLNPQFMQGQFPVNGDARTPDGKGTYIPRPVVKANNLAKAQVPTPAAAAAGAFPSSMNTADYGTSQRENVVGYEAEEEEDEEETENETPDVTEVEESNSEQFRNALISLLGESVSGETISQLHAIFEAAVTEKTNNKVNKIVNQLDENVASYLENVTTTLVEKVDDYLDYVVEEWMQDNNIAVEQGIKTQIAENFITGLKNLFENHYIDVPNEKYNALDELYAQNRNLENSLNATINENLNIKKQLMLNECATIFVAETRDLADTQVAKLQSLMENVSFENVGEYQAKLLGIKNNYLTSQANFVRPAPLQRAKPINEEMTFSAVRPMESSTVENYANVIGKLNKKV
jgi:hypothetical protein